MSTNVDILEDMRHALEVCGNQFEELCDRYPVPEVKDEYTDEEFSELVAYTHKCDLVTAFGRGFRTQFDETMRMYEAGAYNV